MILRITQWYRIQFFFWRSTLRIFLREVVYRKYLIVFSSSCVITYTTFVLSNIEIIRHRSWDIVSITHETSYIANIFNNICNRFLISYFFNMKIHNCNICVNSENKSRISFLHCHFSIKIEVNEIFKMRYCNLYSK